MITTAELSDLLLIAVFERQKARPASEEVAASLRGEAREVARALLGENVKLSASGDALLAQVRRSAASAANKNRTMSPIGRKRAAASPC